MELRGEQKSANKNTVMLSSNTFNNNKKKN